MSVEPLVRLPDGARYLLRPSTVRAIFVDESGETMVDRGKGYQINMGERPVEEVAALLGIPVVEPSGPQPPEPTAEDIKGPPELDVWEPVSSFDVRYGMGHCHPHRRLHRAAGELARKAARDKIRAARLTVAMRERSRR